MWRQYKQEEGIELEIQGTGWDEIKYKFLMLSDVYEMKWRVLELILSIMWICDGMGGVAGNVHNNSDSEILWRMAIYLTEGNYGDQNREQTGRGK